MFNKFDFRALSVGALIYFVGSYLLTALVAIILVGASADIDLFAQDKNEFLIELTMSLILIYLAGFYTQRLSRVNSLNQSLVLGIILFLINLPGTLNQIWDPKGDPFLWNITYDITLIVFAYLGSIIAVRKTNKRNAGV
jgi:hypothetical protein